MRIIPEADNNAAEEREERGNKERRGKFETAPIIFPLLKQNVDEFNSLVEQQEISSKDGEEKDEADKSDTTTDLDILNLQLMESDNAMLDSIHESAANSHSMTIQRVEREKRRIARRLRVEECAQTTTASTQPLPSMFFPFI